MELLIVVLCGIFILITAAISYYRMSKDFDEALKERNNKG